jgi:dihydroxyacetone kinase-like protein
MWLTELDAAIGDGDHGINLDRGFQAVAADLEATPVPEDPAVVLGGAGRRLLGVVGGASGALYGRALTTAGARLRDAAAAGALDRRGLAAIALGGAIDGIAALGKASPGEKTMLDALVPAYAALRDAPSDLALDVVMRRTADAAQEGAQATIRLVARKGRASYLGERSVGHLDPGAASSALLVGCLADAVIGSITETG